MRFILILLFCISCSSTPEKKSIHQCELTPSKTEQRHLSISARLHAGQFAKCFKNYLKFEENKNQSFNVCHKINTDKNGKVIYSKAYGIGAQIPKDFEMCLEQQLRMLDFKNLYLSEPEEVNFSLKYQTKS